jgi:hypothetical protein
MINSRQNSACLAGAVQNSAREWVSRAGRSLNKRELRYDGRGRRLQIPTRSFGEPIVRSKGTENQRPLGLGTPGSRFPRLKRLVRSPLQLFKPRRQTPVKNNTHGDVQVFTKCVDKVRHQVIKASSHHILTPCPRKSVSCPY